MIKPEEAGKYLNEHFEQITLNEFKNLYDRYSSSDGSSEVPMIHDHSTHDVILYQREAAPLRLNAYLASALTGLSEKERERLIAVSDIVSDVCDESNIVVYEPRKSTDPIQHPDVPAEDVFNRDRELVLSSDLVIHIADYASTGAGEELDFALAALIPIVMLSHGDSTVSRMVLGIPALKLVITYNDLDELRVQLSQRLTEIRPILEERKLSFSAFDNNIVGNKVRLLREDAHLTREEIASNSRGLLPLERLSVIEESSDKVSNPSLMELRALSALLKTTVADLAEPDLQERLLVILHEWLDGRVAARFEMSRHDRNKILTRLLLRVIDDLQRE